MVQTEGQQCTLGHTIDHTASHAGVVNDLTHGTQRRLYKGPDHRHNQTQRGAGQQRDHGHKLCAREDAKHRRELDVIVLIVEFCDQKTHQNAAEHAGIQRGNAHDHGLTGFHGRGIQNAQAGQQNVHDIVHGEEADHTGQRCNAFFLFGITNGDGHRKNDRQIGVDRVAHGLEQVEEQLDIGIAQNRPQRHNILRGECGTNAHQNTCNGQDHDRRHQNFSQFLEL